MRTLHFFFLLSLFTFLPAQEKVFVTFNPGYTFYTSENSSKVIGRREINWFAGGSIGYESPALFGKHLRIVYDLAFTRVNDVWKFTVTSGNSPEPVGESGVDYLLYLNNIDLAFPLELNENFTIWGGPSVTWGNRMIMIENIPNPSAGVDSFTGFEDRLATLCPGLNASVTMETPFSSTPEHAFFFASVKMRYLFSAWVDARGRTVSGYQQIFVLGQFNLGVGYNF